MEGFKVIKHRASDRIMNSTNRRIHILLVGCGGTGSRMLAVLARLCITLRGLGMPELYVHVMDYDNVEITNVGRQLFFPEDIGKNKAIVSVDRVNYAYGFDWAALPFKLSNRAISWDHTIVITCTDNISSRRIVFNEFSHYWLDIGNERNTGQVFLASASDMNLESVYKYLNKNISKIKAKKDDGPSCSLAVALNKQSLFINSILAEYAGIMLYDLLVNYTLDYNGIFVNLDDMSVVKAPIRDNSGKNENSKE